MRAVALALLLALAGCATSIMKGYMGQPLQAAVMDYGPPSNAFDLPDGSRAFQWAMTSTYVMPTTVHQTGTVTPIGDMATWSSNTQIQGGQAVTSECLYTMIARWDAAQNAWIFADFRKPRFMCQ